jgi:pectin methylesterase-like acyl-CoA thioesterase
VIKGKCALGRPWNDLHRSIFARTYLDASIRPSGYVAWSATDPRVDNGTFMAEYGSYGPGWDEEGRKAGNVTRVLDTRQWEPYDSPKKVFRDSDGRESVSWIDGSP